MTNKKSVLSGLEPVPNVRGQIGRHSIEFASGEAAFKGGTLVFSLSLDDEYRTLEAVERLIDGLDEEIGKSKELFNALSEADPAARRSSINVFLSKRLKKEGDTFLERLTQQGERSHTEMLDDSGSLGRLIEDKAGYLQEVLKVAGQEGEASYGNLDIRLKFESDNPLKVILQEDPSAAELERISSITKKVENLGGELVVDVSKWLYRWAVEDESKLHQENAREGRS